MDPALAPYLAAWRRRWARDADASRRRAHALRAVASSLAALCRDHGATRVLLIGSVAGGAARPTSDLDLAVQGVAPERFFDLYGKLLAASPVAVDLIDLADCPESLRRRALDEGVDL